MNQTTGNSAVSAGLSAAARSSPGLDAFAASTLDRSTTISDLIAEGNHQKLIMLVRNFIESTWDLNVTGYTMRVYQSRARQFLHYLIAAQTPSVCDGGPRGAFDVVFQAFLSQLQSNGLRSVSVNNYIRFGRMFAKYCSWDNSMIPKMKRAAEAYCNLSSCDLDAYLNCVAESNSLRDQALVTLFVCCSLTIDQILLLRSADIYIEDGTVQIRCGETWIPLPSLSLEQVQSLANWSERSLGGDARRSPAWLFPGKGERSLSRTAADAIVRKYGWKCGLVVSVRALRKVSRLNQPSDLR